MQLQLCISTIFIRKENSEICYWTVDSCLLLFQDVDSSSLSHSSLLRNASAAVVTSAIALVSQSLTSLNELSSQYVKVSKCNLVRMGMCKSWYIGGFGVKVLPKTVFLNCCGHKAQCDGLQNQPKTKKRHLLSKTVFLNH